MKILSNPSKEYFRSDKENEIWIVHCVNSNSNEPTKSIKMEAIRA
ncbi:MAG: hypothetical protein RR238_09540 [Lachnospiraceae bacterium]